MVQGYNISSAKVSTHSEQRDAKRSGFQTVQQRTDKPNSTQQTTTRDQQTSNNNKYGAWGPTKITNKVKMVQGERAAFTAEAVYHRSQESKRAGFENMQKREKENKATASTKVPAANWGQFKNHTYFTSLHHC
ncbi:hypothetical protein DMENIID0001_098460 [Sergentomyia squamirostris]